MKRAGLRASERLKSMFKIIAIPFGWIMKGCYLLVKNYGIALFLFAIITRLVMLPSSIKQQKSSARMAKLRPKLEQIQKKYANNREKLNEATMELYNQEGVSPTNGCFGMILTYIILFAVIEVVYAPMTYISSLPKEKITESVQTVADYYSISQAISKDIPEGASAAPTLEERLADGTNLHELLSAYNEGLSDNLKLTDERLASVEAGFEAYPTIDQYFNDPKKFSSRLAAGGATDRVQILVLSVARAYPSLFDPEVAEFCSGFNYTFLGFDLGAYPSWSSIYVLIPILSLVFQVLLTVISQLMMKRNGQDMGSAKGMMGMMYALPLISFWIAFSFPAGIGIYWIYGSIIALVQTVSLNLYFTPARMEKILAKESKKNARRPSLYQLALEQQKAQQGGGQNLLDDLDAPEVKLSKNERKEIERQKINEARAKLVDDDEEVDPRVLEARKRMAEKYGD